MYLCLSHSEAFLIFRIHSFHYISDISIILSFDYIFRYILSPKHRSIVQQRIFSLPSTRSCPSRGLIRLQLRRQGWVMMSGWAMMTRAWFHARMVFSCDDGFRPCRTALAISLCFQRFHEYLFGVSDFNWHFN